MRLSPVIAVLALLAACGRQHVVAKPPATELVAGAVVLRVENGYPGNVDVQVVRDNVAEKVGMARGGAVTLLTVPARRLGVSGYIRLRARAGSKSRSLTTDVFQVRVSQRIEWTLASDLTHSTVEVRSTGAATDRAP